MHCINPLSKRSNRLISDNYYCVAVIGIHGLLLVSRCGLIIMAVKLTCSLIRKHVKELITFQKN